MLRGRANDGRWLERDRLLLLALTQYETDLCGGCGHPLSETTAPDNAFAYEVKHDLVCMACQQLEQDRKNETRSRIPGEKTNVTNRNHHTTA